MWGTADYSKQEEKTASRDADWGGREEEANEWVLFLYELR